MIHVVGNSHVYFFSGRDAISKKILKNNRDRIPAFKTYHMGAVTAWGLVDFNATTKSRLRLLIVLASIPPGSWVMPVFGEIDCRVHLLKQAEAQKRPLREVVDECVDRYFSVILWMRRLNFKVLIWYVTPSRVMGDIDPALKKEVYLTQNTIVRLFNKRLKKHAGKYHIPGISLYDKLVDGEGMVREEYYLDFAHLSQKAMPMFMGEFNKLNIRHE